MYYPIKVVLYAHEKYSVAWSNSLTLISKVKLLVKTVRITYIMLHLCQNEFNRELKEYFIFGLQTGFLFVNTCICSVSSYNRHTGVVEKGR